MNPIAGIHHVTAIAGSAQPNLDFYTGVLGLRLVKLTVNYDDPGAYHFYFGDRTGRPGTLLTFFPWPDAPRGRAGNGQATAVAFAVPLGTLGYWEERLRGHGVGVGRAERLGEPLLVVSDPDDLSIELIEHDAGVAPDPHAASSVPAARAITGFHSVTLSEEGYERTAGLLTGTMGFRPAGESGNRFRFAAAGAGAGLGRFVDVLCQPDARPGRMGAGVIHHVAFRTADDLEHRTQREELVGLGFNVSPIVNRTYFRSLYFREPGGVLFEMATDAPGCAVDESVERLGSSLVLPQHLEGHRGIIGEGLPRLVLPSGVVEGSR